jgi:nuclear pore complex protein Nup205
MSEVLRQLLYILDDGCSLLDKYNDFQGKEQLENACLYVLMVLERGLQLQNSMLEAARASNFRKLLNPLDKLLLGLNPRSGKPDHMLNVVKFIIFAW